MDSDTINLHAIVTKWIGAAEGRPVRVARFGRMRSGRVPYVCVQRPAGMLFFFRHADGSWCVFPPVGPGAAAWSRHRLHADGS